MLMSEAVYPLLFAPALYKRPWGGQRMAARVGKELPPGERIGESWEIFWKNRIANGSYAGQTLGEVIAAHPQDMIGRADPNPEFPLLVKFLDAQQWLSVQVHPTDTLAAQLEGEPRGKTECWYVVDATPGATLAYGLNRQLNAESLREAIVSGHVTEVLQYVPVQPGDFVFVPAGMMHALGPGIMIYELQQTSDTTYRVYDWDRLGLDGKPRELHLEKSLKCAQFTVNPPAKIDYQMEQAADGVLIARLVRGQYFCLDKLRLTGNSYSLNTQRQRAHLVTALTGHIELRIESQIPLLLPQGTSVFVPAAIHRYTLIPDGEAEVLVAWEV